MRRFLPILVVSLFALFTAQPLFVRQLTCSDDNPFALARAVNLEQLIRDGHIFSRWSPHMAHGYGFPFYNYYGALSSFALVAIHSLGFIYPTALHILFGLCIWGAGLGAYAFAREWWGEAGGVVAAVLYLTAPYLAFDILFRGALAETLALVWLPLILFTLHRALNSPTHASHSSFGVWNWGFGTWGFLASLSFAALMFTHNTSSLAALPLVTGYVALMAFLHRDWRKLFQGGLIVVIGLALSARFWLPALAEINLVQTDRLLVPPIFTYYTNYLSLRELFAPPAAIDPLLINPSPAKALGLVAIVLALVGLVAVVWQAARNRQQRTALSFVVWTLLCLAVYIFLTLPLSQPIWDHVPLVPFIQFPWRFLGPAALCAALLAGGGGRWLTRHQWTAAAAIALIAALGHLSWWYPRYCEPFKEISLGSTLQYEYDTFTIGTTAKGEYLPRTVTLLPDDDSIAEALMRGEQPQYLTGLPAASTLTLLDPDPLNYEATVTVARLTQVTFNQFYFPGWRATLDGQQTDIILTPGTGLITVLIPAGTHTLRFHFGTTPVRAAGDTISIIAIVAVIAYFVLRIPLKQLPQRSPAPPLLSAPADFGVWILGLGILLLLIIRPLVIDRTSNPLRRSVFDGQTLSLGQPLNLNLAGGLNVLSTEFPSSVASGSQFDAMLYLTTRVPTPPDFRPRFDLISGDGSLIWNSGKDALPPRWHREPPDTQYWPVGQYAQWARRETVLPGTPPGEYQLTATIFDRQTLAPDSVIDTDGNPVSPIISLGVVQVTRPPTPSEVSDLNIQYLADYDFGPITLLGYNQDRSEARPGEAVLITLFLRADETMPDLKFNLLDPSYPTSQWQVGDVWRFQTLARIPASAESGSFQFSLSLLDTAESISLQAIQLTAPERAFVAPEVAQPAKIQFGDVIEFAGYTLRASSEATTIDLLWHALATPGLDLIAFVHFEDAAGRVLAQSDAVPVNWSRPTTGWLPGEYLLDGRTLPPLQTGDYTVFIGLADRVTGVRLGERVKVGVYKAP
ncbi:MAG: hypothetical protein HYZ49_01510 [Chloroflexi bacterium]|nr:hypothetical protein [Chloroflexota bacterium]